MKPKWKSWTLWVNGVLVVAAAALGYVGEVAPEVAWVTAVLGMVNGLLRFKTTQPII